MEAVTGRSVPFVRDGFFCLPRLLFLGECVTISSVCPKTIVLSDGQNRRKER